MNEHETLPSKEELIEKITAERKRGKLTVFVGAGVSRLSGMPSWGELIQAMAKEIDYSCGDSLFADDT